ncbi:xanthine dehydrogenase accessory protein XdhC [Paracoccaceae bacterium GXU_MW_L88]
MADETQRAIKVTLAKVDGSAPREEGAAMLVFADRIDGTIGGGALEFEAIKSARDMLLSGETAREITRSLGPEIGQCCGGRVTVSLVQSEAEDAPRAVSPQVLIFGAGHVGRAVARTLEPLPLTPILIDPRAEEMARYEGGAETRLTPLPEAELDTAPEDAAILIVTHDHGLDFLIGMEALKRGFPYVGMIGSATKRAIFARQCREAGVDDSALICPIGASGYGDKRPEVIAAFVATEILLRLSPAIGGGS